MRGGALRRVVIMLLRLGEMEDEALGEVGTPEGLILVLAVADPPGTLVVEGQGGAAAVTQVAEPLAGAVEVTLVAEPLAGVVEVTRVAELLAEAAGATLAVALLAEVAVAILEVVALILVLVGTVVASQTAVSMGDHRRRSRG